MHIKQNDKNSDSESLNQKEDQTIKNEIRTVSPYRIAVEYLAVLTIIIVPLTVQAGVFKADSADKKSTSDVRSGVLDANTPLETPMLSALQNPNPQASLGGAEILVDDGALVSVGPVSEDMISNTRSSQGEISIYTVRAGDTLSHVADMYGVTVNTILWANDMTKASSIREGQVLVILPIVGVRHDVKKGDTLSSIAKKYEGDKEEILSYNQLDSEEDLVIGATIVIPGGSMHTAPVVAKATPTKTSGSSSQKGWLSHPAPGSKRSQGIHGYNGVDLAAPEGTPIRAAAAGEVIISKSSGWNGGYGRYIVVRHSNGAQTLYAHLSRNDVGVGAYVGQGQVIGGMGNTGKSTGSHLHFEVRGSSNPF